MSFRFPSWLKLTVVMAYWLVAGMPAALAEESLTLHHVLQRVIDNYSALEVANLALRRAQQEIAIAQGRLAWSGFGELHARRDIPAFNLRSDEYLGRFGVGRELRAGGSLSLEGSVSRIDSEFSTITRAPNPLTTTGLALKYTRPLLRGRDNPVFQESLARATQATVLSNADRDTLRDEVAAQTIDLFHALARTHSNLANADRSIDRARRLQEHIGYNEGLGLSEEKDILQARAQLNAREADRKALLVIWHQQVANLNRLMGRPAELSLRPVLRNTSSGGTERRDQYIQQAKAHSPALRSINARLISLKATEARVNDSHRNQLDLVTEFGPRFQQGDRAGIAESDQDMTVLLALRYQQKLDDRSKAAELQQVLIDQGILRQQSRTLEEDIEYDVARLSSEILAADSALKAFRVSMESERSKLDEASQRYRRGRADTDELIRFEGDLFTAELLAERQAAELSRGGYTLDLLRGRLWTRIRFPVDATAPKNK